jgi:thiol reductant ABC exporter CydC subunit
MTRPLARLARLLAPQWRLFLLAAVLAAATTAFGVGLMGTSGWLLATAAGLPGIAALQVAIVLVRFFGIGRGLLRYLERLASHDATLRFLSRLRVHVFESIVPAAYSLSATRRSGDLLARLVDDVDTLDRLPVRVLIPALGAILIALCVAGLLVPQFPIGTDVAVSAIVGLGSAGLLIPLVASAAGSRAARATVHLRADVQSAMVDGVQGVADLVALGRAQDHVERVSSLTRSLGSAQVRSASAAALGSSLAGLAADLTVVAILALGVPHVAPGGLTVVQVTAMTLVTLAAFEAVLGLPSGFQELGAASAAARRIFDVTDTPPTVVRPSAPTPVPDPTVIEASGLAFTYPGARRPAISGVSFRLAPGRPVVIVGPSGSGKSTVVALLLRQLEAGGGDLRIGGVDVRACDPDEVRSRIAVAAQRTHLFTGTLRDNLMMARPSASETELVRAATRARMHHVVSAWPDGYDTWIGEQGLQLSGGERQRLALARAFLREAPVLVLDEPTANLDALTEREVLEEIWRASATQATFIATHRVTRIADDAEVLVLRAGEIVERGRAADLRRTAGYFKRMLDLQRASEAVEQAWRT